MNNNNLAPTKTNLLRVRHDLKFAKLGYELLDQKRNILIVELLALVDQAVEQQDKMNKILHEAHAGLMEAVMKMGRLKVINLSRGINIRSTIRLSERKVMGVALPVVKTTFEEHAPFYSPMDTTFWVDIALVNFKKALEMMGRLAELKISIMRLAEEVRKTIRKVNALEKIAIPDLETSVRSIQNRLEESERDMFVLMKMVKANLEKKKSRSQI